MTADFDVAIIGSGFGGSLLAMVARRLGLSVLLVERGAHPRFAVGESTSPLTNLLLEDLARRYDLPRLLPLTTYGAWQRAYPEIGFGLKRGFTYYRQDEGREFQTTADRDNELLVAASPNDEVADTHWLRSDVDAFLMREAVALGVAYEDRTEVALACLTHAGAVLTLTRSGAARSVACRLLVDATGPRGFLQRALSLQEACFEGFPHTRSLFSHFTGVRRTADMPQYASDGQPPYAPDDAALHHVFDDGWMWVLRFNNCVTSAGISVTGATAAALDPADPEGSWRRFLSRYPTVEAQFADARPTREFTYAPTLAYRAGSAGGDNWALLPSAAAFVDPLFSTGIPLTLIGIERLGRLLEETWGTDAMPGRLREYSELTLSDADWTARFVGGCFSAMSRFPRFVDYSMYYFAAASYSEVARRLGRTDLASRFLLQNRSEFNRGLRAGAEWLDETRGDCAQAASAEPRCPDPKAAGSFASRIEAAIRGVNIAGLFDRTKRNWYGIEWDDLIDNAAALELDPAEMRRVLTEADWAPFP